MKLLPLLLLNLATVGVGIVVYDQLRGTPKRLRARWSTAPGARSPRSSRGSRRSRPSDGRSSAAGGSTPSPRPAGGPGGGAARAVRGSRRRCGARGREDIVRRRSAAPDVPRCGGRRSPARRSCAGGAACGDAVQREDRIRKNHARFEQALAKLSLTSPRGSARRSTPRTPPSSRASGRSGARSRPRRKRRSAAGGTIDGQALRAQGAAQIMQEFAQSITGIVHRGRRGGRRRRHAPGQALSRTVCPRGQERVAGAMFWFSRKRFVRIVLRLQRQQPLAVRRRRRCADPAPLVLGHEVHVDAAGGVRRRRVEELAGPARRSARRRPRPPSGVWTFMTNSASRCAVGRRVGRRRGWWRRPSGR